MNRRRKSSALGHPVLNGKASIRRTKASGEYWQFVMWVPAEHATYRKSLRTTDFDTAMEAAEELCLDIRERMKSGKKLFGITLAELVATFVEYKRGDNITRERVIGIRSYLKPFVRYKGGATLIGELHRKAAFDYARWRRADLATIKDETIRHEQSTINMMMKFAYREGFVNIDKFDFATLRIPEVGRRDTFTPDEFKRLHHQLSRWEYQVRDEQIIRERQKITTCIKFAADSALRVGEYRQLRWKDVLKFENSSDKHKNLVTLVTLKVRAETSKTRTSRTITTRGGYLLQLLQERAPDREPDDYIFCGASGSVMLNEKKYNAAWSELMAAMQIDYRQRNVTWYSLRHFAITRFLTAGVSIWAVAKIAGTSVTYIEKHYGHFDQKLSRDASLSILRAF